MNTLQNRYKICIFTLTVSSTAATVSGYTVHTHTLTQTKHKSTQLNELQRMQVINTSMSVTMFL